MSDNTLPLADHSIFSANNLNDTHAHLTEHLTRHRIAKACRTGRICFQHNRISLGDVSINAVQYGGVRLDINITPPEDTYFLLMLLSGHGEVHQGKNLYHGTSDSICVINPGHEARMRLSPNQTNLGILISSSLLTNFMQWETNKRLNTPIEFTSPNSSGIVLAPGLRNFIKDLCSGFDSNYYKINNAYTIRPIVQTLIGFMLTELPHNHSEKLILDDRNISPKYVRIAEDYIIANASEPICIRDISQAVNVNIRTLQKGFKRYLNTTPTERLQQYRLTMAHKQLLELNPLESNVTQIALNCGFNHLSKFASYYKKQYGETPSETLRKKRSVSNKNHNKYI